MQWREITVLTTTQGSEMVSAVLIGAGSAGVMIEDKNDVQANQRPEGQWDIIDEEIARKIGDDVRVTGYYPVNEHLPRAAREIEEGVQRLRAMELPFSLGKLEILGREIDEEDWAESWKKDFHPFRLGEHMLVKPSWAECERQPGDKIIELDPGMAFGTGTHETTSMCARLVEKHVRPGQKVIDVGCGTGILAIAAAHMGAKDILAIDLDAVAVRVARENVERNGFQDKIRVRQGDLFARVDEAADVVIANIIADVILSMAASVKKHVVPGGIFICSGISQNRKDEVLEALERLGYEIVEALDQGEWAAIAAKNA